MEEQDKSSTLTQPLSPEFLQLVQLEASQIIESFRWLATQLVQVATVLSVADLTVIGYAATNNQAGMFLLGAIIIFLLLMAYQSGIKGAVPLLCRLIALENEVAMHLKKPLSTGISLVILSILGTRFLDEAQHVNKISDYGKKNIAMRKLAKNMLTQYPTKKGRLLLILTIGLHIALVPILFFVFGWKFL